MEGEGLVHGPRLLFISSRGTFWSAYSITESCMLLFTSKHFAPQLVLEHLPEKHNRGLELRVGRQVAVEEGSYKGFTARRTCVCGWDTSTSVGYPAAC